MSSSKPGYLERRDSILRELNRIISKMAVLDDADKRADWEQECYELLDELAKLDGGESNA